jgi:hypothetical protein
MPAAVAAIPPDTDQRIRIQSVRLTDAIEEQVFCILATVPAMHLETGYDAHREFATETSSLATLIAEQLERECAPNDVREVVLVGSTASYTASMSSEPHPRLTLCMRGATPELATLPHSAALLDTFFLDHAPSVEFQVHMRFLGDLPILLGYPVRS